MVQRSDETGIGNNAKGTKCKEEWLAWRAKEDKRLYEKYGKPLEQAHQGEHLAIGPEGQTILGKSTDEALQKGVEAFGRGNFGLCRIGYPALGEWLSLTD
jgi:hypothetical protein